LRAHLRKDALIWEEETIKIECSKKTIKTQKNGNNEIDVKLCEFEWSDEFHVIEESREVTGSWQAGVRLGLPQLARNANA
jgi:hypothetical protein